MMAKKKLLINILLLLGCIAVGALAVLYNYSYKICWHCDTQDYYERGRVFVCKEDPKLRESGLDFLRVAAARQQADAQMLLAECYVPALPPGYAPVDKRAFDCLAQDLADNKPAAKELFGKAQATIQKLDAIKPVQLYNLGLLVESGMLAADDVQNQVMQYFTAAAEQGYFPAIQRLAKIYHNRGDYAAAYPWLEKAVAQHKDMHPALTLGDYYMQGKGVAIDYEKAMHWYREALQTVQKNSVTLDAEARRAAEDVPRARMDMTMRKLQQQRMFKFMTVYYRVGGDATTYEVYCEDSPEIMVGTVERNVEGVVASLAPELKRAASVVTPQKTFGSMNEGLDWLLNAYGKSKYGDFKKFDFRLRSHRNAGKE